MILLFAKPGIWTKRPWRNSTGRLKIGTREKIREETQVALSNGDGNQTVSPSNVRFARIVRLGRALRGIRVMRLLRWLKTRVVVGGFGRVGWWETNRMGHSWPRFFGRDLIFRMGWKQTRSGSIYFLVMVTLWKLRMFFFFAKNWHVMMIQKLMDFTPLKTWLLDRLHT